MQPNTLPDVAFHKLTAAVGTPGAGKSYNICGQIAIPVLERDGQLIVIDPTGAWFGLSLKPDGKKPSGYNIAIFGGDHGSMKLTPNMGRAMGELLGHDPISAVLDLSAFEPDEQVHFVSEFAKIFLVANKKPVTVLIDEADEFMPQNPHIKGESAVCKGRLKRFVTRGRKRGVRPVILTQRPQEIDKGVLNHSQVLVAFQCIGEHERKAINGYVGVNGEASAVSDMLKGLSELDVGEAWVWAPRKPKFLAKMKFGKIPVYDSFKEEDEAAGFSGTVPLSAAKLEGLHKALAAHIEQQKANDPMHLKAEIARLSQEALQFKRAAASIPLVPLIDTATIEAAAFERGVETAREAEGRARVPIRKLVDSISKNVTVMADQIATIYQELGTVAEIAAPLVMVRPKMQIKSGPIIPGPITYQEKRPAPIIQGEFSPVEKRILRALMDWASMGHERPSREQVALLAGYGNIRSKGYMNALGSLRSKGAIDHGQGSVWSLNPQIGARMSLPEMHKALREVIDGKGREIMDFLIVHGPSTREQLAAGVGYENQRSKGFLNALGTMRTLTLIDYVRGADGGGVFLRDLVLGK